MSILSVNHRRAQYGSEERERVKATTRDRRHYARAWNYKKHSGMSDAALPSIRKRRSLTEVRRALVGNKDPELSERGAGFIWVLGNERLPPRKRDQFYHDILQFCFRERQYRFPKKITERFLRVLSHRSTGTSTRELEKSAIASPLKSRHLSHLPGKDIRVEYRETRAAYKRKAFKGALVDAVLRPEKAYEPVVLAVLANMPDSIDHVIGKLGNLF